MPSTLQHLPTDDQRASAERAEKEERGRKIEAFDLLIGNFRIVTGQLDRNKFDEDDECEHLCAKRDELLWTIIRTAAPLPRQLAHKFEILRRIMGTRWTDGRGGMLLESIRSDVDAENDL